MSDPTMIDKVEDIRILFGITYDKRFRIIIEEKLPLGIEREPKSYFDCCCQDRNSCIKACLENLEQILTDASYKHWENSMRGWEKKEDV